MSIEGEDVPVTPAIRVLRRSGVAFVPHLYRYVERGGTKRSAEELNVPEHRVVKTLVMEAIEPSGARRPFLVLMHGDREVSTKEMARRLGVKGVEAASEATVARATGYQPGGVSPFGTKRELPVYVEKTILELDRILVNGGKRGFLVEIAPRDLHIVQATEVSVAIQRQ